jgi:mono/diheme cytochrome c family protein
MQRVRLQRLSMAHLVRVGWVFFCLFFVAACHLDMYDQPKYTPYGESNIFPDGAQSRPVPPGVVAQNANLDTVVTTGKQGETFVATNPVAVNDETLALGRVKYNIYCVPCHGTNLDGKGAVAANFRPQPSSLYLERLRTAPDGYLFNVITWGKGQMYPQASTLSPEERWAIVAYIRQSQQTPPEGAVANPTEAPVLTPRPEGTVQPNQPELPSP